VSDPVFDRVSAQCLTAPGREEWRVGFAGAFADPRSQDVDGGCGQWRDPVFAAFAVAGDVWPNGEVDVAAAEPDQLGDP